jgi:rod shape-determining protein MreD
MKPTGLQRLDLWARRAAPIVATLLLAILSVVPLRLPGYMLVAPDFLLMAVFYWIAHRPDLMPPAAIFAIGVLVDLLSGGPLGVEPLVLLLTYAAVGSQRKALRGKPFAIVWMAFALVAVAAKLVEAMLNLALRGALIDGDVFALQLLLTVAIYPLLAWPLARMQQAFVPQ